jgi:transcriptional regulator with XRE-family HTH domain
MNRADLADFLRRRRARLEPADVGLPPGTRRRTAGLRREEVARLAGMSTDYYVRLEQARGPQPSPQMLMALSRALRLSDDERDHIFHLSGHEAPSPLFTSGMVRVGLLPVIEQLTESAAHVVSDLGITLAQNFLSQVLTGRENVGRSYYVSWFTEPESRLRVPAEDHEHLSRVHVADLRATAARRAVDPQVTAMVRRLRAESEEFRQLWDEHLVAVRRSDTKRFIHPAVGIIEVDCEVLLTPEQDQRLVVLSARPGTESHNKLRLLRVVGLQDLSRAEPSDLAFGELPRFGPPGPAADQPEPASGTGRF